MKNGFFQLVSQNDKYGLAIYRAGEGGESVKLEEIKTYLSGFGLSYDVKKLEAIVLGDGDGFCALGIGKCPEIPETYNLSVSDDKMKVTVRFIAASETGKRMTFADFLKDLRFRNIIFGIREEELKKHFESEGVYCTEVVVAEGKDAVQGYDARIEYYFDTDMHKRPLMREDGSVDYFQMTTIHQCKKGELLARIIPEDPGETGYNVFGQPIVPRDVKRQTLKYGRNIELSEDRREIRSMVDGHVSLVEDKVFVSSIFQVKNVDVSTGNIDFEGSIEIEGYVAENFEVKAGGDVIVNGLVEGAKITAGGNIIIAKGMNGMGKGFLKAGRDVVVKFLENARVVAGGYVQTEAIMHSHISAGADVRVEGRRGVIVGGHVQAAQGVSARTIGANMGASTILEVGVNPLIKEQVVRLQKGIEENEKTIKDARVILENFTEKLKKGVKFTESQVKYMKTVAQMIEDKTAEAGRLNEKLDRFRSVMETQKSAEVVVMDIIYPGTTIIIGDAIKTIQTEYHYCKFVKEKGEVCMAAM